MQPFSVHSWPKAIAHVDADAFFVECERVTNPSLRGKCVVVGRERGIVTALSYEAKSRGVKRGMRIFEAKNICPEIVVIESDYEKYSMFSVRMFDILRSFSPAVEEYSIDEAFVDLTGLRRVHSASYFEIGKRIQKEIRRTLGLSVSVGIAPTKVVAKIASKWRKPAGLVAIKAKEIHRYLGKVKIEDVWGIGLNTASLLKKLGIKTALDFALRDELYLKRFLSKPYIQIWHELRGESVFELDLSKKEQKSIHKAASFSPTADRDFIFSELTKNLESACAKARRYGLAAGRILVFLKEQQFITRSLEIKLTSKTNLPIMLIPYLKMAFDRMYRKGVLYRQTGVVLADLGVKKMYDLFGGLTKAKKATRIYEAIDRINGKFGSGTLHLAPSSMYFKDNHRHKTLNIVRLSTVD